MSSESSVTPIGVLSRLIWMMAGPVVLLLLAFNLAVENTGWLSYTSIAFLVCLGVVTIARRVDPNDGEGHPETVRDRNKLALSILVVGIIVWTAANLCGSLLAGK